MSLPQWHELPDDATRAIEAAMDATGREYGPNTADYYVAAAWPHLYAAALRDVADRIGARNSMGMVTAAALHAMADEAEESARRNAVSGLRTRDDQADEDMCPNCVTPWKCNGPHLLD